MGVHVDVVTIQQATLLIGTLFTAGASVWVFLQRTNLSVYIRGREKLIAERNHAFDSIQDFRLRLNLAESRLSDSDRWMSTLRNHSEDQDKEIKRLSLIVESGARTREKLDAFVDWTRRLLSHILDIENAAKYGGVDLSMFSCPPVPSVLADKFDVPEAIR